MSLISTPSGPDEGAESAVGNLDPAPARGEEPGALEGQPAEAAAHARDAARPAPAGGVATEEPHHEFDVDVDAVEAAARAAGAATETARSQGSIPPLPSERSLILGSEVEEIMDDEAVELSVEPGPIEQALERVRSETYLHRIEFYEAELAMEDNRARAALLEHEIGDQLDRHAQDEAGAVKAYARSLASDPMLRPNLWAVRRIFYRRRLWPSLLKLLDAELRYASSDEERAELYTEKGHILEDCTLEIEAALECYKAAHRLDPSALAPLSALEKMFARQGDKQSLIEVYRALAAATMEPGRRVALLVDLARIEEQTLKEGAHAPPHPSGEGQPESPLDRALSYLHAAYEVGFDQLRVVDEIIRMTSAHGRIHECLAALDVKAEILDIQGEQGAPPRKHSVDEQVVAIRRWQASMARDIKDPQLLWHYLQAANRRSPGNPLLLEDLVDLAEALGRWDELQELLLLLTARHRHAQPDAPPPTGLMLRRLRALRDAGRDAEADALEQELLLLPCAALPLLVFRERRALGHDDRGALARIYEEEARIAAEGVVLKEGHSPARDASWSAEALLRAASCLMRAGEERQAQVMVERARSLVDQGELGQGYTHGAAQRRLIVDMLEQVYERTGNHAALADLISEELRSEPERPRALRLHEALVEISAERLRDLARAIYHNSILAQALPEDLRVRLRAIELARRAGDRHLEISALRELDALEQRLGAGSGRFEGLVRRAELLGDEDGEAVALYEEALRLRPGDPRAVEPLEQMLRRTSGLDRLQLLLRQQIDACASAAPAQQERAQRLLYLQIKLADLYESDLVQPAQAAAVYRELLIQRPGHVGALRALCRLYARMRDGARLHGALELLTEALGDGEERAEVLLRLAELYADGLGRPKDAAATYARVLAMAPPGGGHQGAAPLVMSRTHALLGVLSQALSRRDRPAAARALDQLGLELRGSLPPHERAVLQIELAAQLADGPPDGRRAKELLASADELLVQDAACGPGLLPFLDLCLWLHAARHADGRMEGSALARLAERCPQQQAPDDRGAAGLLLRAGILGGQSHESERERQEAQDRLLKAWRLDPGNNEIAMALADGVEGGALPSAEVLGVIEARRVACPDSELDDRLALLLTEGEAALREAAQAADDRVAALRARAAGCMMEALALDPRSVPALLLLLRASDPSLGPEAPTREQLHAHAMYTLRLAQELSSPALKVARFKEAAALFERVGEMDAAAAALRAALDHAPGDAAAFGKAHELLMERAGGEGVQADAGPLLELLDFRLSHSPSTEAEREDEAPLRVALLLQRAALRQAASREGEAIADLSDLLRLDPAHLLARGRLAELLAQVGRGAEALDHFQRLVQSLPEDDLRGRREAHRRIAGLLGETEARLASAHLRQAIDIDRRLRAVQGEARPAQDLAEQSVLYQTQVKLLLKEGAHAEAVELLSELSGLIPNGPESGIELARIELEIADILQHRARDSRGALSALDRALKADPLSLEALDRLVPLCAELGEPQKLAAFLKRAAADARAQAALQAGGDSMSGEPYHALAQIFGWQGLSDAQDLALQAEAAITGNVLRAPESPQRMPQRSVGPPLSTRAFSEDARGILLDLWRVVCETATRLLSPDISAFNLSSREKMSGKGGAASFAALDKLVQSFGADPSSYAIYLSRDRDQCELAGSNLICGSTYASPPSKLPTGSYFRLLHHLALLPDRLGPVVSAREDDLLLFIAACCRIAEVRPPDLAGALAARLDDQTRVLGKALSRKERKGLVALGPRLDPLAGAAGRGQVVSWQSAITIGAHRFALAMTGSLLTGLMELGISPRSPDAREQHLARSLMLFAISPEIQEMRRELGLTEQEGKRVSG